MLRANWRGGLFAPRTSRRASVSARNHSNATAPIARVANHEWMQRLTVSNAPVNSSSSSSFRRPTSSLSSPDELYDVDAWAASFEYRVKRELH